MDNSTEYVCQICGQEFNKEDAEIFECCCGICALPLKPKIIDIEPIDPLVREYSYEIN